MRATHRVHLTADAQVEVDGVHARQECRYITLLTGSDGVGKAVASVGRYRDTLIYERGRWYFARREMVADLSPGS